MCRRSIKFLCVATLFSLQILFDSNYVFRMDSVPLGCALKGTVLEVRNVDAASQVGELWIGGTERVCLINDETDLTPGTMRFSGDLVKRGIAHRNSLSATPQGSSFDLTELFHVGRADDVINRNGKRMNLLEINEVGYNSVQFFV